MVDLTVYLPRETRDRIDQNDLVSKMTEAISRVYGKGVKVNVSAVGTSKKATLLFNDMSPVDINDIETIVDEALNALLFSVNSLDGEPISVTIHATIIYDIEGDIL